MLAITGGTGDFILALATMQQLQKELPAMDTMEILIEAHMVHLTALLPSFVSRIHIIPESFIKDIDDYKLYELINTKNWDAYYRASPIPDLWSKITAKTAIAAQMQLCQLQTIDPIPLVSPPPSWRSSPTRDPYILFNPTANTLNIKFPWSTWLRNLQSLTDTKFIVNRPTSELLQARQRGEISFTTFSDNLFGLIRLSLGAQAVVGTRSGLNDILGSLGYAHQIILYPDTQSPNRQVSSFDFYRLVTNGFPILAQEYLETINLTQLTNSLLKEAT